jgi:Ca2+-binding EF-hand superfamily protein
MGKRFFAVAVYGLFGVFLGTPLAWCQTEGTKQKTDVKSDHPKIAELDKFVKDNDKNNDGFLDRNELPADMRDSFQELDRNKDGKLNREELRTHAVRMSRPQPVAITYVWVFEAEQNDLNRQELQEAYEFLRKLDGNNDGNIAKEEIQSAKKDVMTKWIDRRMKDFDTNTDGKLSRDEANRWIGLRFEKIDQNNDGFVTKDDLMRAATDRANGVTSEAASEPGKGSNDR